jgi:hypothetical protein
LVKNHIILRSNCAIFPLNALITPTLTFALNLHAIVRNCAPNPAAGDW